MAEPAQKPGRSKQDYGTPPEFLRAVEARFGKIWWDLAAHAGNSVAGHQYYGPNSDFARDSLGSDAEWDFVGDTAPDGHILWLNPPFSNIADWAARCSAYCGRAPIVMLTPASIGTEWFAEYVHLIAEVFAIRPRLTFVGCDDPYPKDLMLSVFDPSHNPEVGLYCWKWK